MAAVEAALQQRFGSHAGWAHNTLFISELASQRHHLPAHLQPQGHGRPRAARSASAPAALLSEAAAGEGALQAPTGAAKDEAAVGGIAPAAESGGSAAVPAGRHSRRVVRPKLEAGAASEAARPPVPKRRKKSAPAGAVLPSVAETETAQLAGLLTRGDDVESPAWDAALGLHTPAACSAAPVTPEGGAAAPACPVAETSSVQSSQCSAIHADPLKQALVSAISSGHGDMREWRRRKAQPAGAHANPLT